MFYKSLTIKCIDNLLSYLLRVIFFINRTHIIHKVKSRLSLEFLAPLVVDGSHGTRGVCR